MRSSRGRTARSGTSVNGLRRYTASANNIINILVWIFQKQQRLLDAKARKLSAIQQIVDREGGSLSDENYSRLQHASGSYHRVAQLVGMARNEVCQFALDVVIATCLGVYSLKKVVGMCHRDLALRNIFVEPRLPNYHDGNTSSGGGGVKRIEGDEDYNNSKMMDDYFSYPFNPSGAPSFSDSLLSFTNASIIASVSAM